METFRALKGELVQAASRPMVNVQALKDNVIGALQAAAITARGAIQGLPPMEQHQCDKGGWYEFTFGRSAFDGFGNGLVMRISVEVADPEEQVVVCRGCAFRIEDENEIIPKSMSTWFRGRVDNAALMVAFEQYFFGAIEWALDTSINNFSNGYYQPEGV
jgi:hypothetical protein